MWWIPDLSKKKLSGVLYIEKDGHSSLETIGLFDENNFQIIRYKTIWGLTSDNDEVSLFDCVLTSSKRTSAPFSQGTYTPSVVAIGKHISSWDEKGNYDVQAAIEELKYWIRIKTISPQKDGETWHISWKFIPIDSLKIDENTVLEIGGGSRIHYSDYGMKLYVDQQVSVFFNHVEQISLQDAKRELVNFEQFMSFATLKHVTHTNFWLFDKNKGSSSPIEIFEPKEIEENEHRFFTYLFDYETIKDEFASMIKTWYNDSKLTTIRNYLIDSICAQGYYTSIRFLLVANASNGYYIRYVDKTIREQEYLKKMAEDFKGIEKIDPLEEGDRKLIGNTRHHYSHLLLEDARQIADDAKIRKYTFILRKYVICCVLRVLGLDDIKINEILNKSQNYYINSSLKI